MPSTLRTFSYSEGNDYHFVNVLPMRPYRKLWFDWKGVLPNYITDWRTSMAGQPPRIDPSDPATWPQSPEEIAEGEQLPPITDEDRLIAGSLNGGDLEVDD